MHTTVKVGGIIVCWINKRFLYQNYEISFPVEETLKSLHFSDISDVHRWLDREYEGWVCG